MSTISGDDLEVIEVEPDRPDPLAGVQIESIEESSSSFDDIEVIELAADTFDPLADAEIVSLSDDASGPTQLLGDLGDVDLTGAAPGAALRLTSDGAQWRAVPDGHVHDQLTAAPTWVIDHQLGYAPGGVTLLDTAGDVVEADLAFPIPASRVVVTFPFGVSIAGTAYLS